MENKIEGLVLAIIDNYNSYQLKSTFTMAVSGIDAAGKGYISKLLAYELNKRRYNTALINIDPWQNPIPIRLQKQNAAENIFRWNDFF